MQTRTLIAPLVIALALTACGDDGDASVAIGSTTTLATDGPESPSNDRTGRIDLSAVTADVFTVHRDCGSGFFVANDDGTIALELAPSADAVASDLTGGSIAESEWSGAVLLGADLLAEDCADDRVPGEPTPVVDEELPLVDGVVEIVAIDGVDVKARVGGLRAETIDGRGVDVGDVRLTNAGWGVLPGA